MKVWNNPQLWQLGLEMTAGKGNEEYTDPNNRPEGHSNWVWCTQHSRWHSQNHS